jgi:hypothetical protein
MVQALVFWPPGYFQRLVQFDNPAPIQFRENHLSSFNRKGFLRIVSNRVSPVFFAFPNILLLLVFL